MNKTNNKTLRELTMKRIYVDMDEVLCNYKKAYDESRKNNPEIEFPQSKIGFFENLEPIEGAIESVNQLRKKFEVYILTAPSNRNPHCYTEKRLWIEKHFDYEFTERLIISSNKSLLKGDYLIDDYAEGKGQERFEGQLIHFGTEKFCDWQAVMQYFSKLMEPRKPITETDGNSITGKLSHVVWAAILDGKYQVEVQRESQFKGILCIFENSICIFEQSVELSYGARFGPDASDLELWQELCIDFIENQGEENADS